MTIQAQILELIKLLQDEEGMSVVFITHDMGVVAEIADRVVVMWKGKKVEEGADRASLRVAAAALHPGAARRRSAAGLDEGPSPYRSRSPSSTPGTGDCAEFRSPRWRSTASESGRSAARARSRQSR